MELLTSQTFKTKIFNYGQGKDWRYEGGLPAIVEFYTDSCGSCKMLMPVLEEISRLYQGKLHLYKVDAEKEPNLFSLFHLKGVPSLLFIPKTGKPRIFSGFLSKEVLQKAILEILEVVP